MKLLDLFNFRAVQPSKLAGQRQAVVALGGGGARGLSHLGVMQAIAESSLALDRIVGVSIGSMIGALCAIEGDARQAKQQTLSLLNDPSFQRTQECLLGAAPPTSSEAEGDLFSWYSRLKKYVSAHRRLGRVVSEPSLLGAWPLTEVIDYLIPNIQIEETKTPLSLVAADLLSGHQVVLETGSLRTAVAASMAIPGIFPPVPFRGMLLCDIGVLDSIPIDVARSYPHDLAIGVDVGLSHWSIERCSTALDVMMRMNEIGERLLRRKAMPDADLIIRPDVGSVAWFDFSEPERLIRAGYQAGRERLRSIGWLRAA